MKKTVMFFIIYIVFNSVFGFILSLINFDKNGSGTIGLLYAMNISNALAFSYIIYKLNKK